MAAIIGVAIRFGGFPAMGDFGIRVEDSCFDDMAAIDGEESGVA